jgi:mannuronan 5-epimerase
MSMLLLSVVVAFNLNNPSIPMAYGDNGNNNSDNNNNNNDYLSSSPNENCISYDPSDRIIMIRCRSASLTDVYNQLNDDSILNKQADGVWLLNAGIIVDNDAALIIDSKDTSWLKIVADGKTENSIQVSGSLRIDSVKITSWDPAKNYYAIDHGTRELYVDKSGTGMPRPYILVRTAATGTTDITNSELAYLGYKCIGGKCSGIRYFGGDGSTIRGNNIHHNGFGFYSNGVANILYEDNEVHHNTMYGIDPHTGTHDMIIRNNTVHDNGSIGIICSLDCYHITIENNVVYNNTKAGIMFSRNMFDSIARNNVISNQEQAIFISQSHDNEIYNNTISNSVPGILFGNDSFGNTVHDNTVIVNPQSSPSSSFDDVAVENGADRDNAIYSNTIINNNNNNDTEPRLKSLPSPQVVD